VLGSTPEAVALEVVWGRKNGFVRERAELAGLVRRRHWSRCLAGMKKAAPAAFGGHRGDDVLVLVQDQRKCASSVSSAEACSITENRKVAPRWV
jgi:hypothetical protein